MLNAYIPPDGGDAVLLHNTAKWQVALMMGGLCVELLYKERACNTHDQAVYGLSLHDCYPSMLIQGEPASDFVVELARAQRTCSDKEIDRLMLDAYLGTLLQAA